ncbi:type II secretion system protein GspJ [Vibrio sp. UCD-FRSSP16_10]|uniref:type II secretion system minor pseudopilin GspJ n=1 Tax=unclassified Vibrio TaxID=2614977 RepID=UPI0007FFADBC|nr:MULTISPECIES: type II secretion system minor pseudopilin GspJ [unclassified Vibrio]OBT10142.1 type II secretion system protein GspJ [Vibrio sp. UCD-FRSSP16_30]OBT18932.1 type II secretion system protein GspJ [Vibrio sp. UCD-FRSSP16_10]
MSRYKRTKGFTLIEVLVAIAVFAGLSIAAYQVVFQIQLSNKQSQDKLGRLQELQATLVYLDSDFRQIAVRRFRNDGQEAGQALIYWQDNLIDSDAKGVLFSRLGWINPQQQFPRGEITKVGYRVRGDKLERVWWRYPDTPVGQEGIVTPLLSKVEKFDLRFYDGEAWVKEWTDNGALPKAIAVDIKLEDYGKLERIYLTADGKLERINEDTSE